MIAQNQCNYYWMELTKVLLPSGVSVRIFLFASDMSLTPDLLIFLLSLNDMAGFFTGNAYPLPDSKLRDFLVKWRSNLDELEIAYLLFLACTFNNI